MTAAALPDIQIIYFGQTYEYTLPWHNAWVLLGITVPVTILVAGVIGIVWGLGQIRRDRLPLYFLVHFLTLPVLRMLPSTPAHDGVRLFLPTFFFLAAFAGWGTVALGRAIDRKAKWPQGRIAPVITTAVLGPAALSLVLIHPFELSYFNMLIGGPKRRLASRLRADLLVGRLQRRAARRAEPAASPGAPRLIFPTNSPTP